MKHGLFVNHIGTLNMRTGQAQRRLGELKIQIKNSSDLGATYHEQSVEDMIKDGLKVDENGNITNQALKEYFQGLANRRNDFIWVRIFNNGKWETSCFGPQKENNPSAASTHDSVCISSAGRAAVNGTGTGAPVTPAAVTGVAQPSSADLDHAVDSLMQQALLRGASPEINNSGERANTAETAPAETSPITDEVAEK